MDKYERRRQRLILLRDTRCHGRIVDLAKAIDRDASYVGRMLYPEGKKGKKRIADDMIEVIETAFRLPDGWLSQTPEVNEGGEENQVILPPRFQITADDMDDLVNQLANSIDSKALLEFISKLTTALHAKNR